MLLYGSRGALCQSSWVQVLNFRVLGGGFRLQGLGFRVTALAFEVSGAAGAAKARCLEMWKSKPYRAG